MTQSIDHSTITDLRAQLARWVSKSDTGRVRLDQEVFTNQAIFDLEMEYIFERNWVFLGHESQVVRPNDFMAAHVGREPVVLVRTRAGDLKCFINACTHRGARLCRQKTGSAKFFRCSFHGWTFANSGELLDVTDEGEGGYPGDFEKGGLGLHEVKIASYRGFVFASLTDDVPPLDEYLGDTRKLIDLLVQQSPEGELEVLHGTVRYIYHGNWKLQAENGVDGYHAPVVHANYIQTTGRRVTGDSSYGVRVGIGDGARPVLGSNKRSTGGGPGTGGFFSFPHGHQIVWGMAGAPEARANSHIVPWLQVTYGEEAAWWTNKTIRNLLLFPNVFLMDQNGMQIRIIRPLSVDETEVISYGIAPRGEAPEIRNLRIRQFEDFMNATGMATPDDLAEFNNCQIGFGKGGRRSDIGRGATRWVTGGGEFGKKLGIEALMSSEAVADEGLFVELHEEWLRRMEHALDIEEGRTNAQSIPVGELIA
ncbi:Rieske 2Fe-2S domain-containing protein [Sphingobium sp. TB-6]|uniref:aromatic ring-hydroxylating oxygenase subunit alpha n=1 Tax=Sphingobium sp. TB-6 TaxID=2728850 RepID=UPI00146F4EB4|nr:Rieske 2Fe-2S domain-containing protein [Sphingobium sp. TB-6]NML91857.1 Rieske 2Fe-2S domain-containing protein [Sphingobium sp. TB-6]